MKLHRYIGIAAVFGVLAGCGPTYKLDNACQRYMESEHGPGVYPRCWYPANH